ncbi:hypothetical protein FRC12_004142 [Ceratobasidium sp. 428]|nr:hypothetical protein FRC12_004142 [Ceratobasidium sp. 428]
MNRQAPPPYLDDSSEESIPAQIRKLESLLQPRAEASARGDAVELAAADEHIICVEEPLLQAYPEEENRTFWQSTLNNLRTGNTQDKEHALGPFARGLKILVIAPFAVAGGAIFATGSILYGVGKVIQGLGTALTCGVLR